MKPTFDALFRIIGIFAVLTPVWAFAAQTPANNGQTIPKPSFQLGDQPSQPLAEGSKEAKKFIEFYNKTYLKNKAQIPLLKKEDVVWFPPQSAGDTSLESVGRLTVNEKKLLTSPDQQITPNCDDPSEYPILCEEGFNTAEFCRGCHDSVLFVEGGGLQQMAYFSTPDFTEKHKTWLANWSQYGDWSSSIMRLATRDPIWQAQIETETNTHPYADPAVIQDVCFSCHGEMGERQLKMDLNDNSSVFCTDIFYATIPGTLSNKERGKPYPFTGDCEPFKGKPVAEHQGLYAKYGSLARDGVSCETCHRIGPDQPSEKGKVAWDGSDVSVFYGTYNKYDVKDRQPENPQPLDYEFTATFDYNMDYVLTPDPKDELNPLPMLEDDNLDIAQAWNKKEKVSYLRQGILCGSCHVLIVPQIPTAYKPGAPLPDKTQFPKYKRPKACDSDTFAAATNGKYGNPVTDPCVALGYEQTTYLEWINSDFGSEEDNENTCQGCHMPYVTNPNKPNDHSAVLAQTTDDLTAKTYRRHRLMGINLPVFEMFMQFPDVLGVNPYDPQVPDSGYANTKDSKQSADYIQNYLLNGQMAIIEQATSQANGNGLPGKGLIEGNSRAPKTPSVAATHIDIKRVSIKGKQLKADILITNNTGHKFPSGAGFRRGFVKFEVLDESKNVLWVSGQPNPYGAICNGKCIENNGTYNLISSEVTGGDPSKLQPHHAVITRQNQVQIYEIQDVSDTGVLTSSTLSLFKTAKDNRILPMGFKSPDEIGCAEKDGKPTVTGRTIFGITRCSAAYATQAEIKPLTINSAIKSDKHYTNSKYAGSDAISYAIPLEDIQGTASSIRVTMEYQTIPPAFLAARFEQGYDQEAQAYLTATERSIYLTSHLNTNLALESEHPDNKGLTFSKNWTSSLYQTTAKID